MALKINNLKDLIIAMNTSGHMYLEDRDLHFACLKDCSGIIGTIILTISGTGPKGRAVLTSVSPVGYDIAEKGFMVNIFDKPKFKLLKNKDTNIGGRIEDGYYVIDDINILLEKRNGVIPIREIIGEKK